MSIPVQCVCGGRYQANPQLAGQWLNCPACGGNIQVPAPDPLGQPADPLQLAPPLGHSPHGSPGVNQPTYPTPAYPQAGPFPPRPATETASVLLPGKSRAAAVLSIVQATLGTLLLIGGIVWPIMSMQRLTAIIGWLPMHYVTAGVLFFRGLQCIASPGFLLTGIWMLRGDARALRASAWLSYVYLAAAGLSLLTHLLGEVALAFLSGTHGRLAFEVIYFSVSFTGVLIVSAVPLTILYWLYEVDALPLYSKKK